MLKFDFGYMTQVSNDDDHKKSVFSQCKYIYFMLKPAEYIKLTYSNKWPILFFIQISFIFVQHSTEYCLFFSF